jgi:hypothetical protein
VSGGLAALGQLPSRSERSGLDQTASPQSRPESLASAMMSDCVPLRPCPIF